VAGADADSKWLAPVHKRANLCWMLLQRATASRQAGANRRH